MKGDQFVLVIVMIGRAKIFVRNPALCHERKISLRRLHFHLVGGIESLEMFVQHMAHGLVLTQPKRAIQLAGKQTLGGVATVFALGAQLDGVARRAFQHEQRNLKKRIRTAGKPDFLGDGFHAGGIGHKIYL